MHPLFPVVATGVFSGKDATRFLAQIGATVSQLDSALRAGEVEAANTDEFYPPTAAGTYRWNGTVAGIRRTLHGDNAWKLSNLQNQPRIVRPDGLKIIVVGSTPDTGLIDGDPRAARKKGAATRNAIAAGQTMLDFSLGKRVDPARIGQAIDTWALLYYRDKEPNQLRAELSLATGVEDGQFAGWLYRLILPAIEFEAVTALPDDAGGEDVSFDVTGII